jgi:hypothetical protein
MFLVQPMMARYILPWFGGSPMVWTTSMLFFQLALIVGYAYAHFGTRLSLRVQGTVHVALLCLSLLLLPITPDDRWMRMSSLDPGFRVLGLLAFHLSIPILLISSTSPLLQRWHALTLPAGRTYRLYALSNGGSLLGLLAYPFLIAPWVRLHVQTLSWSVGYGIFVLLSVVTTFWTMRQLAGRAIVAEDLTGPPPGRQDWVLWLLLSACGSSMLLAVTNQLCQDIAVVPFFWIMPLALYLVTFMLTFDHPRWYDRRLWGTGLCLGGMATTYILFERQTAIALQVASLSATLLAACMVCHGELARLKPVRAYLTRFYMVIAVGGALGGVFVGVLAPRVFHGYWELHAGVLASLMLLWVCAFRSGTGWAGAYGNLLRTACVVSLATLIPSLAASVFNAQPNTIAAQRGFYGVLRVYQFDDQNQWPSRALWNGAIRHGMQWTGVERRHSPTTYYGPDSGGALAIELHPARLARVREDPQWSPLKVGVVGLGVGTLAAYGRPGDRITFYEIDDQVLGLARRYFTFLEDSAATVNVVIGDARINLASELETDGSQEFDVLVLDAFASDSVPVHLLTREAFELYWAHLKPDGILAIHVSSRHLDLSSVIRGLGAERKLSVIPVHNDDAWNPGGISASDWILLASNSTFLNSSSLLSRVTSWPPGHRTPKAWTDDYSNLLQVLR